MKPRNLREIHKIMKHMQQAKSLIGKFTGLYETHMPQRTILIGQFNVPYHATGFCNIELL